MAREPKITPWFNPDMNAWQCRAHYWDDKGYSTKTCATSGEAQSFINTCKGRKPTARPNMEYAREAD